MKQIKDGNSSIFGLMIESNLNEGSQPLEQFHYKMKYGVSVTDGCINWLTTETLLRQIHNGMNDKLKQLNRINRKLRFQTEVS
ncbi:hypothetical protein [Facilibium subflavum]|uniref:hypothetical protein n=1 Tax=Facilibium subflavum TaxID=2219058 RepID=UPI000E64797C|nr:hypothetical protein [Facilibium subflavum]